MDKWYNSKAGWLSFFSKNFGHIRPLVAFHSGSFAGNQLDKYKGVNMESTDEELRILYGILHKAWEDAPDVPWIRCMTGWYALCDLCCEGPILWEEEHASALG